MQSAGICSAAILIFTWAVFCGIKELRTGETKHHLGPWGCLGSSLPIVANEKPPPPVHMFIYFYKDQFLLNS